MKPSGALIDPPTPFDSVEAWERFIEDIRGLADSNPEVREELNRARAILEALRVEEAGPISISIPNSSCVAERPIRPHMASLIPRPISQRFTG